MFLIAIIFSGTLGWLFMGVGLWFDKSTVFTAYWPSFYSLFGGLLFGIGAAVNSGCGVSTISRLARGELVMLATIAGWVVAWIALIATLPDNLAGRPITMPGWAHYAVLVGLTIAVLVVVWRMTEGHRKLWASMLGIGLMAGVVFVFEPHWTPSGLLNSISATLWYQSEHSWPSGERFWLMAVLLSGMVVAAVHSSSFSLRLAGLKAGLKHLGAGVLMGLGAVMAGGGNDTQLLVAMPALSPAGVASVASIVIGIYLGIKLIARG
ncbi:YeeE/YedE thiosulfate transporter family protein [Vibrio sp. WXL103]|uniref:YeeE/YedE thiosulfate transporter family protein n=1 Tax=unclassified Vibrio TaxID=2614977 RepID=UPI003EC7CE4C